MKTVATRDLPKVLRDLLKTRKRNVTVHVSDADSEHTIHAADWSGGSRTFTTGWAFIDGSFRPITLPSPGGFPGFSPAEWRMLKGTLLLETGTFCGKTSTPRLTIERSLAASWGLGD